MASLVLELQTDAINENVKVSQLLRKALLVATKLNVLELKKWCENELRGYESSEVSNYRRVRGQLRAMNPLRGSPPWWRGLPWPERMLVIGAAVYGALLFVYFTVWSPPVAKLAVSSPVV
jgi:hypothetical protein